LDINRIESGKMVLELQKFSLRNTVNNLIQENIPAADLKKIQLTLKAEDEPFTIMADSSKIERVIGELIGNAIKYTGENGIIEVQLSRSNDKIDIRVKDNGTGISPENCEKIWERFYQVQNNQYEMKGSGLGLSIAKEIAEMHSGTITVSSNKDEGTVFTVVLPSETSIGEDHD